MSDSALLLRGRVHAEARDAAGRLLWSESGRNLVVNSGVDYVARLIGGLVTTPAVWLALGSNNTPPQPTDTALYAEATGASATRLQVTPVWSGAGTGTITYTATWSPAQDVGLSIGEFGLFTASTGGVMIARYAFATPYPAKDSSTSFTITYALTVAHA